jgi:glucose/arabinose dehydrogenase
VHGGRSLLLLALLCMVCGPAAAGERALRPLFSGPDRERPQVAVRLKPLTVDGQPVMARSPTEIRFLPGSGPRAGRVMVIAERRGALKWIDLRTGETGYFFRVDGVGIDLEQGLLGFDFDPAFPARPYVYTHHVGPGGFGGRSVLTRWTLWGDDVRSMTAESEVLLELSQPQASHNGGQVAFGPDGMLYVGFGDGGWEGDPRNRGQDRTNLFGTIIRIDVSGSGDGLPYRIPADNPFLAGEHQPEVWAFGFRNPEHFDFGPDGSLLLGDVGQDRLEEIDQVHRGGNYGWSLKEGSLCFGQGRRREGACDDPELIDPIHEYRIGEGWTVIGGKFYAGRKIDGLDGRFLFGDPTTGRMWAITPASATARPELVALGGFGIAPACFGRDLAGEVYVGVQSGRVYKVVPGGR